MAHCVRQPAAAEFPLWPNALTPGRNSVRAQWRGMLCIACKISAPSLYILPGSCNSYDPRLFL